MRLKLDKVRDKLLIETVGKRLLIDPADLRSQLEEQGYSLVSDAERVIRTHNDSVLDTERREMQQRIQTLEKRVSDQRKANARMQNRWHADQRVLDAMSKATFEPDADDEPCFADCIEETRVINAELDPSNVKT